ncbi:hypothetical protein [Pararhizobium gei]|uniref:hypothetical protein n=1 Tax=Pararhizobium gei TaxID=1395951 RepID=UPI0023DC7719|nr:hypothetical protein [Rhizobium gei]
MADIIRLEDRLTRSPPKPSLGPAVANRAVILLFTGIRYERLNGQADVPLLNPPDKAKQH